MTRARTLARLLAVLVVIGSVACSEKPPHGPPDTSGQTVADVTSAPPSDARAPEPVGVPGVDRPQTGLDKGVVVFEGKRGEVAVEVEVARTDDQRRIGLMLRPHVPDGEGMIFLMPDQRVHAFWMKNTLTPLDMVFVDATKVVVGIVVDAEPLTLSPRTVGVPSSYVVELPAGFTARAGIASGDHMRMEGIAELR